MSWHYKEHTPKEVREQIKAGRCVGDLFVAAAVLVREIEHLERENARLVAEIEDMHRAFPARIV